MARFTCNFISYTLLRAVDITVIIPSPTIPESLGVNEKILKAINRGREAGKAEGLSGGKKEPVRHTKTEPYPVLYLLHGMGNNHATWTGYSNVELYAEERNIAVVMLSAENKAYVNHPGGDDFFEFIENELPDFVCGMFPVSGRPEDTYIAGLSMGGYGAAVHGLNRTDGYAAVGAFSGAYHINPFTLSGGEERPVEPGYNPGRLAGELRGKNGKIPKLYIACGENDVLYEGNKSFKDELIAAGADVTWVSTPGYGHEWRYWDMQVEAFLDWLPRTDAYARQGRRQC